MEANQLKLAPCLPAGWAGFKLRYRYKKTGYAITVVQHAGPDTEMRATLDGASQPGAVITLVDDQNEHLVEFRVPKGSNP